MQNATANAVCCVGLKLAENKARFVLPQKQIKVVFRDRVLYERL